jgi:hypothetical protein
LFSEKHLIIGARKLIFKFYAFSKPDLLQNMAWKVLVDYMKRIRSGSQVLAVQFEDSLSVRQARTELKKLICVLLNWENKDM